MLTHSPIFSIYISYVQYIFLTIVKRQKYYLSTLCIYCLWGVCVDLDRTLNKYTIADAYMLSFCIVSSGISQSLFLNMFALPTRHKKNDAYTYIIRVKQFLSRASYRTYIQYLYDKPCVQLISSSSHILLLLLLL